MRYATTMWYVANKIKILLGTGLLRTLQRYRDNENTEYQCGRDNNKSMLGMCSVDSRIGYRSHVWSTHPIKVSLNCPRICIVTNLHRLEKQRIVRLTACIFCKADPYECSEVFFQPTTRSHTTIDTTSDCTYPDIKSPDLLQIMYIFLICYEKKHRYRLSLAIGISNYQNSHHVPRSNECCDGPHSYTQRCSGTNPTVNQIINSKTVFYQETLLGLQDNMCRLTIKIRRMHGNLGCQLHMTSPLHQIFSCSR